MKLALYIITGVVEVEGWGLCEERGLVCVKGHLQSFIFILYMYI